MIGLSVVLGRGILGRLGGGLGRVSGGPYMFSVDARVRLSVTIVVVVRIMRCGVDVPWWWYTSRVKIDWLVGVDE